MSSASPRKSNFLLHRWVGLSLALIAMLVFFSGSIAVFHEELDSWALRGTRSEAIAEVETFDLDQAYLRAAAEVPEQQRHQVAIRQRPDRPLFFFFHEHVKEEGKTVERGTALWLNPSTLEVIGRRQGTAEEVREPKTLESLTRFFIDLHIFLLMPRTPGLIATGLAGFGLLVLIVTGYLVLKPTRKSILQKPRVKSEKQLFKDLHTLVGTWTIPYTLALSLSGAFFSLATPVLLPVIAMVAFDGDQEKLVATVLGEVEVSDSADTASLQPLLKDAEQRSSGGEFFSLSLDQWGSEKANAILFIVKPSPFGGESHNYVYDGHNGEFLYEKPAFGNRPSIGNTLIRFMGYLHFGTLFGWPTKILWSLFGLITMGLAASGLAVYLLKQAKSQSAHLRLIRASVVALVAGLPLATAVTGFTWIACNLLQSSHVSSVLSAAFLLSLCASGLVGLLLELNPALRWPLATAGLLFLLFPWAGSLVTKMGPLGALALPHARSTVVVDLVISTAGALLIYAWLRLAKTARERQGHLGSTKAAPTADALSS